MLIAAANHEATNMGIRWVVAGVLLVILCAAAHPITDGCSTTCALPLARDLTVTYINAGNGYYNATLVWDVASLPSNGFQSYCKGLFRWMVRWQVYEAPFYDLLPNDLDTTEVFSLLMSSNWTTLGTFEQNASFTGLSGVYYYIFQIKHSFTCNDTRKPQVNASYVYRFGPQIAPTVVVPYQRVVLTEGDDIWLNCTVRGNPLPAFIWAQDLRYKPNNEKEQGQGEIVVAVYPIYNASSTHEARYWCIGTSVLVNPPLGKRMTSDMNYIDVIVKPRNNTCKSEKLNSILGLCYFNQERIFYQQTSINTADAIKSYFAAIDVAAQNTSGCADVAKELLCFSMFPLCDPSSSEPRPLPVCSQTCRAFTRGQCGAVFNNSYLYSLITSNCGLSTPVAGDMPECMMSSKLTGNKIKTGSCVSGNGQGYQGWISVTASGLPCQQWSVQAPQKHIITPNTYAEDLKDSSVFCRNPGGLGEQPWCYTTDPQKRWEYCNIPKCETCELYSGSFCSAFGSNTIYVNREVFSNGQVDIESKLRSSYNQLITKNAVSLSSGCNTILRMLLCQRAFPTCTVNGTTAMLLCQDQCNLLSTAKMCLGESLTGQLLSIVPEASLQCAESRASNPQCLPLPQWEQFEAQPEDTQGSCYSNNGATYSGTVSLSESGSRCQYWSNSTYKYLSSLFPDILKSKNYCRNPGGLGTRPWCFNEKGKMEYCSIPLCKGIELQNKAPVNVVQQEKDGQERVNTSAVIAVVSVAAVMVIAVVILGVIGAVYCSKKQGMKSHLLVQLQKQESKKELGLQYNPHYFTQTILPANLQSIMDSFHQLDRSKVHYIKELGRGNFGVVFLGKVDHLKEGEGEQLVAVKTLKDETPEALHNFISEAKTMFSFNHPNIVKIHAVCTKESPYYMVFEYMDKGDLAHFLQENASSQQKLQRNPFGVHERTESSLSNNPAQLSCEQLIDVCKQIASGMDYLSKNNHIHRDLACRNCLVSSPLSVKIGDFGMSQNLYTRDYYRVNGKAVLPIRWMSPEAVVYGKFTTLSDVWSFGVVMWEVFSFAMQPYYGVTNEEVTQMIRKGKHLDNPPDCPDKIYEIMVECWNMDPSCRPTFSELYDMLVNYHSSTSTDEDSIGGRGLNDSVSLNSDVFSETSSYDGEPGSQPA